LSSGKAKADAADDDNEVQMLGSASEDEWRPRRRTRQAAAEKKYGFSVTLTLLTPCSLRNRYSNTKQYFVNVKFKSD